jgi:hypothetical protein
MTTPIYNFSNISGFNDIINNVNDSGSTILKLNKVECRTSNNTIYRIVRYDKNFLNIDLISTYGLCRSVIINNNNKVVGIAPPKSIPCHDFIKKYDEKTEGIVAEEFIEGTMMNVFWDDSIGLNGAWEISTRNTVGATSSFYKGPKSQTFRDMFLEALKETNLLLDNLEKEFCYSFVLQHPSNRIVVPFKKPQLYLVAVYSIFNETDNIYVKVHNSQDFRDVFHALNTSIRFPGIYKFDNYSELIEKYGSMNTSYDILGVVLYNRNTGERAKIRNPVYEQVRNLRGNQPKLQYQYLCLRKEGKVGEFLKFYPENKKNFSTYRDQVHLFTDTLFKNYISCYIKKEKPLILFSDQYRTHMFNLHQKYLNELREKKQIINSIVVQKYVNEMQSSLLMYCLNFQMRKRNVDTIAVEMEVEVEVEPDDVKMDI